MLVAPGSAVKLVLSKGPLPENGEAIELPNLLLQTLSEAQALLEKTGFSTGSIEKAHDENVPYGRVISQSPSAYRYLPPGTPIDLVISLGAEPRIGVPSLAGMDALEALDMLEELALVPGIIEQVFDTLIPAGHVSGQDPAPGTRVKKGSSVNLRISNGRDPDELTENEGEGNTDVDPPAREGEPDEALPDEGETTAPDGNEEALPEEGEIPEREKEPVSACDGCSGSGKALGDYLLLGCVMLLLAQSSFFRK
jgi:serine/threonine-protein kinase